MAFRSYLLILLFIIPSYLIAKEDISADRKQQKSIITKKDNSQDLDEYYQEYTPKDGENHLEKEPYQEDEESNEGVNDAVKFNIRFSPVSQIIKQNTNVLTDFFGDKKEPTPSPNADAKGEVIAKEEDQSKTADGTAPTPVDNDIFEIFKSSIMFSSDDIYKINQAIADYSSGGGFDILNPDNLDQFSQQIGSQAERVSPSIYLNSIIYISDTDWRIWLNNKLKSNSSGEAVYEDKLSSVKLLKITDKYCIFELNTASLSAISPNWKTVLKKHGTGGYTSADGNVRVIKENELVRFTLNVNQTFVTYDMKIVEGYKDSVTIKLEEKK